MTKILIVGGTAINLAGHGCILIAKDVEILKELQKHRDNCFIARQMPEVF